MLLNLIPSESEFGNTFERRVKIAIDSAAERTSSIVAESLREAVTQQALEAVEAVNEKYEAKLDELSEQVRQLTMRSEAMK